MFQNLCVCWISLFLYITFTFCILIRLNNHGVDRTNMNKMETYVFKFSYPKKERWIKNDLNDVIQLLYSDCTNKTQMYQMMFQLTEFPKSLESLPKLLFDVYPNDSKIVDSILNKKIIKISDVPAPVVSEIKQRIKDKFLLFCDTVQHLQLKETQQHFTKEKIALIYRNQKYIHPKKLCEFLIEYRNGQYSKRITNTSKKSIQKKHGNRRTPLLFVSKKSFQIFDAHKNVFYEHIELPHYTMQNKRNFVGSCVRHKGNDDNYSNKAKVKKNIYIVASIHESTDINPLVTRGFDIIANQLKNLNRKSIDELAERDEETIKITKMWKERNTSSRPQRVTKKKYETLVQSQKLINTFGRKQVLIATLKNTDDVIGIIMYRQHECFMMEILLMAVRQDYRSKRNNIHSIKWGIGSFLLDTLKKLTSRNTALIFVKSDLRCVNFYKRNGFVKNIYTSKEIIHQKIWETTESVSMECRLVDCKNKNNMFLTYDELKNKTIM